MCGRENEFARHELTRSDVPQWGTDSDPTLVGQCVDCGEAIRFETEIGATPLRARRWEVWAAFALLAAIGGCFVYGLLSMTD